MRTVRPVPEFIPEVDKARFWSKVDVRRGNVCWEWSGSVCSKYGRYKLSDGGSHAAHRIAYALLHGAIPDRLILDHLCQNKICVNPDHLEPVTVMENARRAFALKAGQRISDVPHICPNGHPRNHANTAVSPKGRQYCRDCKRELQQRVRERKRAA